MWMERISNRQDARKWMSVMLVWDVDGTGQPQIGFKEADKCPVDIGYGWGVSGV